MFEKKINNNWCKHKENNDDLKNNNYKINILVTSSANFQRQGNAKDLVSCMWKKCPKSLDLWPISVSVFF